MTESSSTPTTALVAVARDKFNEGQEPWLWTPTPGAVPPYEVVPLTTALTTEYPTDAHLVTYAVYRNGVPVVHQPRITKDGLSAVRDRGFELRHLVWIADVDTPGHQPITTEQIADARVKLAAMPTAGWYTSRAGLRVIQPIMTAVTPEQYEIGIREWLAGLQEVLGPEWVVDMKCTDWTRHFRLPYVIRDNQPTRPVIDIARMAAIEVPEIIVPPQAARVPLLVRPSSGAPTGRIERARAYVSQIGVPVCGSGECDATLWSVCLHVVRGFELDGETAFSVVSEWASASRHGWSEKEIRRKITDAARAQAGAGFHLDDRHEAFRGSYEHCRDLAVLDHEHLAEIEDALRIESDEPENDDDMSGESTAERSWKKRLLRRRGAIRGCVANVVTVLRHHPSWVGALALDEFRNVVVWTRTPPWTTQYPETEAVGRGTPWTDDDATRLITFLNHAGIDVGKDTVRDAVRMVSLRQKYHPVREYLDSVEWDGTERLGTWLAQYLGAEDNDYNRKAGTWWMVQAVRRIFEPGALAKYVLTIEGPQDLGKSLALRRLCGVEWFADGRIDIGNKEGAMTLQSVWIYELAEGELLNRASKEALKQFIGQPFDHYVPKWSNLPVSVPRQTVFAMTVNEQHYLTDPTGNVRFWPVRATAIDIEQLTNDRDQLWAEAVALYRADVIPEPRSTEDRKLFAEVVGERVQSDPWETAIESALDTRDDITVEEILTDVLDIAHRAQERKDQLRVVAILRRLGWERGEGRPTRDGKRVRLYVRMSPRLTLEPAAPRPLTLAEHAAWTALSTAGWTETVLPSGRRVWTQVDAQAQEADELLQAV